MEGLDKVFKAAPKSVFEIISEPNVGYYMPAYQRPYSWNKENIERLFDDLKSGVHNLTSSSDSITFLGTLLTVDDSKAESVFPQEKGHLPTSVKLVIDGQQRLSTLILMLSRFHEAITIRSSSLDKDIEALEDGEKSDAHTWLSEMTWEALSDCRYFTTELNTSRDPKFKYLPKIIRAHVDCWGKTADKAIYDSPIAGYLSAYSSHIVEQDSFEKYQPISLSALENSDNKIVFDNIKAIDKQINLLAKDFTADSIEQAIKEIDTKAVQNSLDFDVPEYFTNNEICEKYAQLVYLILFVKYLLHRVCLTYVTVNSESYAFDMFEALNTTGEPLTSFETFRPKVIEYGNKKFQDVSYVNEELDEISDYLDVFSKADVKHKQTTRLMTNFALLFDGSKLSRHISPQRSYLLKTYDKCDDQEKSQFVTTMKSAATFIFSGWDNNSLSTLGISDDSNGLGSLSLSALIEAKHEIVTGTIVFFYMKYQKEGTPNKLVDVIKSICAFFALWRAYTGGTSGIDNVYRKLHSKGCLEAGLLPLTVSNIPYVTVESLNAALKVELAKKVKTVPEEFKSDWLRQAVKTPVHSANTTLSKLLALAGSNDVMYSQATGQVEKGKRGSCTVLSAAIWNNLGLKNKNLMLSPIHDGSKSTEWDESTYDSVLCNTIGNLQLLVKEDYKATSQSSWMFYQSNLKSAVVESDKSGVEQMINSSDNQSDKSEEIISEWNIRKSYLEVMNVPIWNKDAIEQRSLRILGTAWDNLITWL